MTKHSDDWRLELLQGTLDMLILRTLQWGDQQGHGIGQAIRTQSDDLFKVETGSLYPALHRRQKRGWLKAEWGVSEANQRAAESTTTQNSQRSQSFFQRFSAISAGSALNVGFSLFRCWCKSSSCRIGYGASASERRLLALLAAAHLRSVGLRNDYS
jgi:hypothetical protein